MGNHFLEYKRNGEIELYKENGTFYNHGSQDLLIATLYDKEIAEKICKMLNEDDSQNNE